MTRQPVYDPYKHVVFGFCVSTRLANCVGFWLASQPSRLKPDTVARFANTNEKEGQKQIHSGGQAPKGYGLTLHQTGSKLLSTREV